MEVDLEQPARYLRFPVTADRLTEITGRRGDLVMDRSLWRASNLFAHPTKMEPVAAWHARVIVDSVAQGGMLAVAIEGVHGVEGAYAAVKVGDRYLGAPDRAAAYPSNTWEYVNARRDRGYTYYLPVTDNMIGRELDVYVLAYDEEHKDLNPVVWQISRPQLPGGIMLELASK